MDLPAFHSLRQLRPHRTSKANTRPRPSPASSDSALDPSNSKRAGRTGPTRHLLPGLAALCVLIAFPFLILVELGTTYDRGVLRDIYFLKLDLSHIIPRSVPNAVLINSIARTLGLHDFYQVGLWNYCEGYHGPQGITSCSSPRTGYWFDPVSILLDELLAGATIALPSTIVSALSLVRTASHWMAGLFLTATVLTFLCIPLSVISLLANRKSQPLSVNHKSKSKTRRILTIALGIFVAATAVVTTVATVIATVMFVIFRNVFTTTSLDLSIGAQLGAEMFAFMWIAVGFEILGMGLMFVDCCCCCCSGARKARCRRGGINTRLEK